MADGLAEVTIATPSATYGPVRLGLRGAHQVANALVAVRLLEQARESGIALSADAVVEGLAHPDWPARLELFTLDDRRRVMLDAAHNVDGATALADYVRRWHPERPTLVLGVMHDKDVDAMLRALLPVVSAVIATAAPTPRAMAPEELSRRASAVATELRQAGGDVPTEIDVCHDPEEALRRALERSTVVCVAGSIFLAGAVREGLRRRVILR